MKRTEIERIERELKRTAKKEELTGKRVDGRDEHSPGVYIERLYGLFRYDDQEIFNTREDVEILEVLEQMQENLPQKKWDDVIRKAIKKAGVKARDKAFAELKDLMGSDN